MPYTSPTTVNASKGIGEFFIYLNDVTNYWFSNGLLITIWVIILMGYLAVKKEDYIGAFAVTSYVTFVLALIGFLMELVAGYTLAVTIGLSLVATGILLADKGGTA